ncbi:hypothetical protein CSC70_05460 [Pseudoxanthomonas kalamensis DSM 18571]|uniref:DUF6498-containing protein n=1 Tax=Pseudoxanthomonas kalamensis TaxID=289483 RepID=UPI001390DF5E|nr:DUF6498-containing protein [Pseudoxanthomonas kalamensis]KAF1711358.1 hypothetical protein CSC70_05460 [Pseudoxanthomonas kalamensis DSM 18571]
MRPQARNLILSNLLTLVLALILHWEPAWLVWPYWIQSVVIGWYARKRMLALDRFSTEGFTSNDRPVPEDERGKRSTATFFSLHYGLFHLAYLVFLCIQHPVAAPRDLTLLALCGLSFVLAQRQTYQVQHAADLRGRPNLGSLMFLPYIRILPMHLIILAGGAISGGTFTLVAFTVLKTLADLGLDAADRRIAENAARRAAPAPRTEG